MTTDQVQSASSTKHGKKRMKKRMGIGSKGADRQAELAAERGLPHKDTTGRLHKWIVSVSAKYGTKGTRYVVYNMHLFVFNADYTRVITTMKVPVNLQKVAAAQLKRHAAQL